VVVPVGSLLALQASTNHQIENIMPVIIPMKAVEEDRHWPLGRGSIDFELFGAGIDQYAPQATLSLEVNDAMNIKMTDLRKSVNRYLEHHLVAGEG